MARRTILSLVASIVPAAACVLAPGPAQSAGPGPVRTVVVSPAGASPLEVFAGREARRYLYLRTGKRVPFIASARLPNGRDFLVVSRKDRPVVRQMGLESGVRTLGPQQYVLKTLRGRDRKVLAVIGGDDVGTLYGAYRLAERLGVRFYLHGDTVPDRRIPLALPDLDERGKPFFALRGIQPFHDFPEGPDWWDTPEYLSVIGQLPKLRMNFVGLHTYPEGAAGPEATVWLGLPEDARPDGTVARSYPAFYHNTALGTWGYAPRNTGDYSLGAAMLFDRDAYGPEVIRGLEPRPSTPEASNALFNRTAEMLRTAFAAAHSLGVKTCVGTETPLTIPAPLRERLAAKGLDPKAPSTVLSVYEGIFRRAAAAYPLDYYWLWTPESWTWSGASGEQVESTLADLKLARGALTASGAPFRMATSGWVLGPQDDRALLGKALPRDVAVSAINRQVGMSPVEPAFAEVTGREKWAIPWMEDDPALTQVQLWAGRMRADAHDALRYGCSGLMGIHWRTRALSPNVAALASAAWEQPWAQTAPEPEDTTDGLTAAYYQSPIAGTEDDRLYQDVRYGHGAYRISVPDGVYRVTLRFVEPHYDRAGVRVFDVSVEGRKVLENLDVFAVAGKDRALDHSYEGVRVSDGGLDIGFTPRVEFPCIAAIDIEGAGGFVRKVNCGGPAYRDWEADITPAARDMRTGDFYRDWALAEFGPEVAAEAASILESQDGRLPRPSGWTDGPGGITPDARPWQEAAGEYAFVDRFAALGPRVRGAGSLARFDYWLHTFRFLEGLGRIKCAWGAYNAAMEPVRAEEDPAARADLVRASALPARVALVRAVTEAYNHLLATVSTTGEMGTVTNLEQPNLPGILGKPGEELARAIGEPLPPEAVLPVAYSGPARIIVTAPRASVAPGEAQDLRVIVLSAEPPKDAALFWKPMGGETFRRIPLRHSARGVYRVALPRASGDHEYYIRVTPATGAPAVWPASAPAINHTVVLGPAPEGRTAGTGGGSGAMK